MVKERHFARRMVSLLMSIILMTAGTGLAAASYSDMISGVLDDLNTNNARCSSAPQQSANGAYRLTDMLAIIALEHGNSAYASVVSEVLDDLTTNDASCSGAPQQTANGCYRMADMLSIIALEVFLMHSFRMSSSTPSPVTSSRYAASICSIFELRSTLLVNML